MRWNIIVTGLVILVASQTALNAQGWIEKQGKAIVNSSPVKIGPPGGGVCVGPLCVDGKGKPRVRSADEVIEDTLNGIPGYALLSDADKKNIHSAVVTTGIVTAVISDPVGGTILTRVLFGNGEEKDVPVPENKDAPQTGKTWDVKAACIVQQEKDLITAYFDVENPPDLQNINDGDAVSLTAPVCPLFKEKSVTSVKIKKTGGPTPIPGKKPPAFTWILAGRTI